MTLLRLSRLWILVLATAWLAGCGDSDGPALTMAEASNAASDAPVAGSTPFIAFVTIHGDNLIHVASVNFTVDSLPGAASKPVNVTYSIDYLQQRGYVQGDTAIQVPVFGLYAGTQNALSITLDFSDQSTVTLPATFTTAADVSDVYTNPSVTKARAPNSALGFDYFYVKSGLGPPVILDTDARVRWRAVVPNLGNAMSTYFYQGGFEVGDGVTLYRIELDGNVEDAGSIAQSGALDFHHDLEAGKTGLLDNVDVIVHGAFELESVAQEIAPDGTVQQTWDLAQILRDYMRANGDDPDLFVRPSDDWFHMNTAFYDASDDSVIISSRENFVIKLDYATGDIRWILGDTTKYWYTFPSLRAKSLELIQGIPPVGQHAVNIAPDGNMLLFNDGEGSISQPPGAPPGITRDYSEVSSYAIDETAGTASETWGFDYGRSVFSPFCSSARQVNDGSVLVDYATAEDITAAYLVGLNPAHEIVFDYRYPENGCSTAWNSQPIPLEALSLQ